MNTSVSKIISKLVLSDSTVKVKLLGDSITHGVGGTGFCQNGEKIANNFSRNKDGYCWAKLFKEHVESQFDAVVTNNGCTGTKIEFIIDNFNTLVDDDDDIIICTIGTNNRHQNKTGEKIHTKKEHMQEFYNNIIKLNNMFIDAKKDVIFIANIPAGIENETRNDNEIIRIFHMCDVNDIYLKASAECNFAFISLYNAFMEYIAIKEISLDSLLADGLHPNDEGYDVMFKLIMNKLGLARKILN